MGSRNVEATTRAIEVINSGDFDAMESRMTDDVTIDFSTSIGPYAGVYRGKQEARAFLAGVFDAWEKLHWQPREVVDLHAGQVLLDNVVRGRGRGSGIEVEGHGAQIWTLRDGLVSHVRLFQSRAEAEEWLKERE
jgi:ketosteroid isomerase-like protein